MQLPATVFSQQLKDLNYDRSLFQRLQANGLPVSLLNVQYRMVRKFYSDFYQLLIFYYHFFFYILFLCFHFHFLILIFFSILRLVRFHQIISIRINFLMAIMCCPIPSISLFIIYSLHFCFVIFLVKKQKERLVHFSI